MLEWAEIYKSFDGFVWGLVALVPMLYLQSQLRLELLRIFYRFTRSLKGAFNVLSFLFFPGLFLHEASHWVTAFLLGIRTFKMRVFPEQQPDGSIPMGYVVMEMPDFLRGSLIGLAPLIAGSTLTWYLGLKVLKLDLLWNILLSAHWATYPAKITELYAGGSDWLWVWAYVLIAVSIMMVPSDSDLVHPRRLLMITVGLLAIALAAGYSTWILENIVPYLNDLFRRVSYVFGMSALLHLLLLFPTVLLRRGLYRA